ncbi:hypothetical protein AAFF_G00210250 [Aldrovandia affinis]|uniref:Uncharacterized protein n=1 Tax=Aldrovandia affinis TaxID=143900 RepID=A0AAD7SW98_9TELE|nr:hypothetical protein AAFF_G00210250 [Aldrovandia affinis]
MDNNAVDTDTELMESTNIYMDSIMENLPASVSYLDNLREHLKTDNVCSAVMQMCQRCRAVLQSSRRRRREGVLIGHATTSVTERLISAVSHPGNRCG